MTAVMGDKIIEFIRPASMARAYIPATAIAGTPPKRDGKI